MSVDSLIAALRCNDHPVEVKYGARVVIWIYTRVIPRNRLHGIYGGPFNLLMYSIATNSCLLWNVETFAALHLSDKTCVLLKRLQNLVSESSIIQRHERSHTVK